MLQYIINDLADALEYLLYGLGIGAVAALLLVALNKGRLKRDRKPLRVFAPACLAMYATVILCITFLSRELGSRPRTVDLELFATWGRTAKAHALVIENIILFVPFGYLLAWNAKWSRHFLPGFLAGGLVSLGIESMQLLTGRGYFQIDDVLTNTIGTLIGIGLWCLFHIWEHKKKDADV